MQTQYNIYYRKIQLKHIRERPLKLASLLVSRAFFSQIEVYFYLFNNLKNSLSEIIFILPCFLFNSSALINFLERISAPNRSNCLGPKINISVFSFTKLWILAPHSAESLIASSRLIEHKVPVNTMFLPFNSFIVIISFTMDMTSS